jgi:hypothetical protein
MLNGFVDHVGAQNRAGSAPSSPGVAGLQPNAESMGGWLRVEWMAEGGAEIWTDPMRTAQWTFWTLPIWGR